ncbi:TrmB family transcriptional regulator [Endozoicomonas lisbonensis]|uniref:Sugar-specific transcriptional regulator TrmB n=1 Tax=Endozoicomonas lisbonensis TaxID=3120522 RepID=A0ABV2SGX3_9GAMM
MTELINKLMSFGLTKTDALVYINLLQNGQASGYKIGKDLSLARSSVYSSIDTLYNQGYIFMIEGSTKEYEAKSPELILSQIKKKTLNDIAILKKELAEIAVPKDTPFIYNLSGYENLLLKVRELINSSTRELYINTDFNLQLLSEELGNAINRGVRVLCFSFNRLESPVDGLEIYSRNDKPEQEYPSRRFMMVADIRETLIFSNIGSAQGIYTNEKLFTRIISEHIHSDVYLSELMQDKDFIPAHIATAHENEPF